MLRTGAECEQNAAPIAEAAIGQWWPAGDELYRPSRLVECSIQQTSDIRHDCSDPPPKTQHKHPAMFRFSSVSSFARSARSSIVRPSLHVRSIVTVKTTPAEENSILVAQRKNRPVSPHLEIYEQQLTAVMSALHRITGVGLAAGFYGVTVSYAFGIADTASLVALYSAIPVVGQVALKALASFPFAFHAWNGIRHLIWDSGREANIKGVYTTGYIVLGLTTVSALALLFA